MSLFEEARTNVKQSDVSAKLRALGSDKYSAVKKEIIEKIGEESKCGLKQLDYSRTGIDNDLLAKTIKKDKTFKRFKVYVETEFCDPRMGRSWKQHVIISWK